MPASKIQAKVTKVTLARPYINIQQKPIEQKKPVPTRAQLKVVKQPEKALSTKILQTEENSNYDHKDAVNGALFDLRDNKRPETTKIQSTISTAAKAKDE